MKVGWQGTWYELRTLLLPFIFIFNPELLMIDIGGPVHFVTVVGCAVVAMMAFVAALQGFFLTRSRWWETAALLLVCFTLFRPNFWMDQLIPPREARPAAELARVIDATAPGGALRFSIRSEDFDGDEVVKAVRLGIGRQGDARVRLAESGITTSSFGGQATIASVRPGSEAARLKLKPGDRIDTVSVPVERPSPFLFAIPALLLLLAVAWAQRRRRAPARLRAI
jgi:hypothetical protein